MTRRLVVPAWLLILAACLWWLGVVFYDVVRYGPTPYGDNVWLDWRQMAMVHRIAPLIVVPFAVLALWGLVMRFRKGWTSPARTTWACGAAALLWTGFVLWRAHDQAFKCAVWAGPEILFKTPSCWLPQILASVALWLTIPIFAWLVLAATRVPTRQVA